MTRQLALTLLSALALAGIIACGGSDIAVPEATTDAATAVAASATSTVESSGSKSLLPGGGLPDADAPDEILLTVENLSLCNVFDYDGHPGDLDAYFDMFEARGDWADENYIRWSQDGSQILFDISRGKYKGPVDLYAVAADGSRLEKIVDASARRLLWGRGGSMMYFDVSPDGSRIAYSACAYNRKYPEDTGSFNWVYNYDIALANIDGTEFRRLTATPGFENFPVWSPDGRYIAYFSSHADFRGPLSFRYFRDPSPITGWITIYNLETGEFRHVSPVDGDGVTSRPPSWSATLHNVPGEGEFIPQPPVWSPDGEKLAFVVYEGAVEVDRIRKFTPAGIRLKLALYTVGVDGTGLTRITDAASGPAWSPDGKRIAVAVPGREHNADLYTFEADGSNPVLAIGRLVNPWHFPYRPWMGNLSWSPDGSQIMFDQFARRVSLDGSPVNDDVLRYVTDDFPVVTPMLSAWSPDGSSIAIRAEDGSDALVYIINQDGSKPRHLVVTGYPWQPKNKGHLRLAP